LFLGPGCDRPSGSNVPDEPQATGAESRVDLAEDFEATELDLEQRTALECTFRIEATGAIEVALDGVLTLGEEPGDPGESGEIEKLPVIVLEARGQFAGAEYDADFRQNGAMVWAGDTNYPPYPALREAVVIGMTRMGLLHNLARLIDEGVPDHAKGGVRDWVKVVAVRAPSPAEATGRAYAFDIVVDGVLSGEATLHLDDAGRPARRVQTVHFEEGDMQVTEIYDCR
jgi:hypothetical protein